MIKLVVGLMTGCLVASASASTSGAAGSAPGARPDATATAPSSSRKTSPYRRSARLTPNAEKFYVAAWGVDKLKVSSTSSGNLLRFSYRVSDPARAGVLGDKKSTPYLLGLRSKALLRVPVMDKVGQLRQAAAPEVGKEYWMVFSNKGQLIKPGDRVNVMIGAFHADGLLVEGS
jgi:hypothetical protein